MSQDFLVLREASGVVLRVNRRPIDDHVEDAFVTFRQRRLDADRGLDGGRQTGGLGGVVSLRALGRERVSERMAARALAEARGEDGVTDGFCARPREHW